MAEPATIVIFGASGDLTKRKLIPALFHNFKKGRLAEQTSIVGFARTEWSDAEFVANMHEFSAKALGAECSGPEWEKFSRKMHYVPGELTKVEDFKRLDAKLAELEKARAAGTGRLYYLSIGPQFYPDTIRNLGAAGMAAEDKGWRRVIIEKPFGHDLASATELNGIVHAVFKEKQVYRIDHYLGKETVQNVLVFRFANTIFEPIWNRNYIDHVQITVAETVPVGSRGGYYDKAGVLRDMFQNHILQVMSIVAMEPPAKFEADALRDEKVKVFDAIRKTSADNVHEYSVRGQYFGYHDEPDVPADSATPTFAALRLDIDNWRWRGVPFYLRSGKSMAARVTEIVVQFLCPPHVMFDVPKGETLECNRLVIRVQPNEGILFHFQTKVPDQGMKMRPNELSFFYQDSFKTDAIPEAYERLLLDALNGDASLFTRSDEIELCWSLMDPILEGWARDKTYKVPQYAPGSWGPNAADRFMERDGRKWIISADAKG